MRGERENEWGPSGRGDRGGEGRGNLIHRGEFAGEAIRLGLGSGHLPVAG